MKLSNMCIAVFVMAIGCNDDFSDPSEAQRSPGFRDASVPVSSPGPSADNEQSPASNSWNQPTSSSNERTVTNNIPEPNTENDANGADPEPMFPSNPPSTPQPQQGDSPGNNSGMDDPMSDEDDAEDDSENEEDVESPVSNDSAGQNSNADMEEMPADNELENDLVGEIQEDIDASCVSAGCHATQNNLRSLEDIEALIGQTPYGSGTPYIVPGNKEASYLYNVLLPPNERNVGINGGQMPPPYRPNSLRRTARQLQTLRDSIGRWIDNMSL